MLTKTKQNLIENLDWNVEDVENLATEQKEILL